MLRSFKLNLATNLRGISTAIPRRIEDDGDWFYSSEWWGTESDGNTVFRSTSDKGNGIISVLAYHSSRPNESLWAETENWLQQRHAEIYPYNKQKGTFKILGYQWRTLRFNDDTRQSTAKVMVAYKQSEPGLVFLKQEAHCLAVPYIKSMVSAGLASIASCDYDLESSIHGKKTMKILCVGHGGGSLPLFLAHKIPGAIVHIVEIDPLVVAASTHAMGFPKFSIVNLSGERAQLEADPVDQVMWKGTHERLFLYESDAEQFIVNSSNTYDLVFVDAYDGDDVFPRKLWDPDSLFLKTLEKRLHPEHGTVVVNLHSDTDLSSHESSQSILPMGKYVSRVCKAYKKVLLESEGKDSGLAFTVSVPWVCNTSLVVCRGFRNVERDMALNTLISKSLEMEKLLSLPFSCLMYIKRGFIFVD